ncbi:MAG TPA: DNA-3-methyladenine glycosylase [Thermoanaerobaculia bacterium]|nr:DNA-3-methyladenine glycosylase [Thermoanaerobaculia bacterium]
MAARDRTTTELTPRPPFDGEGLMGFLAARALPGVEKADGNSYERGFTERGRAGTLRLALGGRGRSHSLSMEFPAWAGAEGLSSRARRLFDLSANPRAIGRVLSKDPLLAPLVARRPGLRVPGAWDPFEISVRAVLGQQISVAGARTLAGRLVALCGRPLPKRLARPGLTHVFPLPEDVAEADVASVGLPRARATALKAFARAVADGSFLLAAPHGLDEFEERLTALPGFGPWTAHVVALRALGEGDAFPDGDLGLVKAMESAGVTRNRIAARAERWRPYRAYATLHLWASLADGKGGG